MLSEGEAAPTVCLPGYVEGERERVDLDEYVGEGIVVLAFYPADFNPACSMQSSDLGDLDLFTMQKDVSVFGVSPDSTYSHEAFAERYSLHVPLLSDGDGAAAAAYGVDRETDDGEPLPERAVFVIDHRGVVQYAWSTTDLAERIDVAPVKEAVGAIGGDETALERYRVGYEHYAEGREAFTSAMGDYEDREWLTARGDFEDAEPAFGAAADHFNTAVRFAETDAFEAVVTHAEEKADTLQHAADWLGDSADALGGGRGKQGTEYREDAQRLLDAASDLPEPPDSGGFALTDDGIALPDSLVVDPEEDEQAYAWRADEPAVDTDLGVDDETLDAAVDADEAPGEPAGATVEGDTVEGDLEMDLDAVDADDDDRTDDPGERIEGDTVEGDLEMDLDAVDAAGEAGDGARPDGRADEHGAADGTDAAGGTGATAASSGDATGAEPTETSVDAGTGAADGGLPGSGRPAGPSAGDASGSTDESEDGVEDAGGSPAGDSGEDVEELTLADPTEGEDEEEDDERADWDIPGQ